MTWAATACLTATAQSARRTGLPPKRNPATHPPLAPAVAALRADPASGGTRQPRRANPAQTQTRARAVSIGTRRPVAAPDIAKQPRQPIAPRASTGTRRPEEDPDIASPARAVGPARRVTIRWTVTACPTATVAFANRSAAGQRIPVPVQAAVRKPAHPASGGTRQPRRANPAQTQTRARAVSIGTRRPVAVQAIANPHQAVLAPAANGGTEPRAKQLRQPIAPPVSIGTAARVNPQRIPHAERASIGTAVPA